jgi:hypothetical protein
MGSRLVHACPHTLRLIKIATTRKTRFISESSRIIPRNGTYLPSKNTVLLFHEEIFRDRLKVVGELGTPGQIQSEGV